MQIFLFPGLHHDWESSSLQCAVSPGLVSGGETPKHLLAGLGLPRVGSIPGSLLRVQLAKRNAWGTLVSMERSKPEMNLETRGSQVFLLMGSPDSASAQREVRGPYPWVPAVRIAEGFSNPASLLSLSFSPSCPKSLFPRKKRNWCIKPKPPGPPLLCQTPR